MANLRQEEKNVILYYIGSIYEQHKITPTFEVKGRPYPEANPATGVVEPLKLGDPVRVREGDVADLMRKSRIYISGKGQYDAFTTREDVAAAIVQQAKNGNLVGMPTNPTLADMLKIAPSEEVKAQLTEQLSVDDLQAMLEKKQAEAQKAKDVAADIAKDQKEAKKEKEVAK